MARQTTEATSADCTAPGLQGAPVEDAGDRPSLLELVRSDVDRYSYMLELDGTAALPHEVKALKYLRALLMCQGLQASLVHRVGHALAVWAPSGLVLKVVRIVLRLMHWTVNRGAEASTGISISEHAVIGRGLYIGHFGGVIIGVVRMGDHCTLSHGVTVGRSGRRGQSGRPEIGDRVWIGPRAVVVGGIEVGDDALVGANSVVTRSIPPRSSALGAPAVIRPASASFDMVVYRGAEEDSTRVRSRLLLANERATLVEASASSAAAS